MSKFEPTSEKLVFVGYASDADAYLLLNPATDTVIKERNLKVIDGRFPFCDAKDSDCEPCCCRESPVQSVVPPRTVPELFVTVYDSAVSSLGGVARSEERASAEQPDEPAQQPDLPESSAEEVPVAEQVPQIENAATEETMPKEGVPLSDEVLSSIAEPSTEEASPIDSE